MVRPVPEFRIRHAGTTSVPPAKDDVASHDDDVVDAAAHGDAVAFGVIYKQYESRVRGICRRYLKDPRDVDEAVQDTFTKAYVALPRLNGSVRLGAWLARIATNSAIDVSRRNLRRPEIATVFDDDAHISADTPEQEIVGGVTPVHEVLSRISREHARALRLRAVESASHVEIGDAFGKSPQQAKALLHRAREAFRRTWQEVGGRVAFAGVAGALALWRIYRGASPALARVHTAGSIDNLAVPAAAFADAWPMT